MRRNLPATKLSTAGQRALSAFLEGRLPAGRLHEELVRAAQPVPPLERVPAPASSAA